MQLLKKEGKSIVSHRNTSREKHYLTGGIEVRVTQRTEVCRLLLIIPKTVVNQNEKIKRKNSYLSINLQRKREVSQNVTVKVRIPYRYDSLGIIKEEPIKIDVDDENFLGTVTAFPKMYLSETTREMNERKMEAVYLAVMHDTRKYKPSTSKYSLYTHTNVSHPYQGGTPKWLTLKRKELTKNIFIFVSSFYNI